MQAGEIVVEIPAGVVAVQRGHIDVGGKLFYGRRTGKGIGGIQMGGDIAVDHRARVFGGLAVEGDRVSITVQRSAAL